MTEGELILLAGVTCVTGLILWLFYFATTNDSRSAKKADPAQETK